MLSYSAVAREIIACCTSGAVLTLLVVVAYLIVPLGIAVPEGPSLLLAVLGIVTFFCLVALEPKLSRLVPVRSVSMLLIGAGVLARILPKSSFIQSGLKLLAVTIPPERSIAVSTVLLCVGYTFLTVYFIMLLSNRRQKVANHPMHGSGEVGGIEVENFSSPPRDR